MVSYSLSAPLSQKQKTVWALISKGLSVAAIANKMKTTRQFVNQTKLAAEAKLATTLMEVAQTNDLQITKLCPKQAILLGYHPSLQRKAIVTYSTKYGIKVWYWHDNPQQENLNPEFLQQTRQYLLQVAKERGIQIDGAKEMHPAKLATLVFGKMIPELKP
ncbi:MAG: hypothetical protein NWF04_01915 [Candidatus Bathyarchaeota archaeon]|nr:hypothetical protein [Candidatus Bathyarchaeota archaeon]